jgi:transcriptional regulator with XRE-family HTH domain
MALSDRVGLSRASIANIENGRQHIHLHTFLLLAEAVSAYPKYFLPETESLRRGVYEKLSNVGLANDMDTVSWVERIVSSKKKEGGNG